MTAWVRTSPPDDDVYAAEVPQKADRIAAVPRTGSQCHYLPFRFRLARLPAYRKPDHPGAPGPKSTHPPPPLEITARHLNAGSLIAPHSVVALIVDNPQCFPAKDGSQQHVLRHLRTRSRTWSM